MNLKLIASLFIALVFIGCDTEKTTFHDGNFSEDRIVSKVPLDIGLFEIVNQPAEHTWRDVDLFYKNILQTDHKHAAYFNNLRNMVFSHLINQFKMLESADLQTIEFYAKEQMKADFINNTDIFLMTLEALKGTWTREQREEAAFDRYNKNIAYINENFEDPKKGMDVFGDRTQNILDYAKRVQE